MEKVRKLLRHLDYQEIRKRKLDSFMQEEERYRSMPQDELRFEYIELKVRNGRGNIIPALFIAILSLAVLMGIWDIFFKFMNNAVEYAASYNAPEVAEAFFYIGFSVAFSVTFLILSCLISAHKDGIEDRKKLMVIEIVMKERSIEIL